MKRNKIIIIISAVLGALIVLFALPGLLAGAGRKTGSPLPKGNIEIPAERTIQYKNVSQVQEEIIDYWSKGKVTDWVNGEKVNLENPRTVLGCLLAGKRVEEINRYLLKQNSTGNEGSRWLLNPKGGYDFNAMAFTPVLFLFDDKPELLYPETKKHLVNNILTIEGAGFTRYVPYTRIQDSENHILMAESSRYLKNQWIWNEGNHSSEFNNVTNGVERGLKDFLQEIYQYGMYEFNSEPYLGYSFSALLNLDAFAEGDIKILARKILDQQNWLYALGSYKFKHFPPYRRLFAKTFKKGIDSDYHTAMMKVWVSFYNDTIKLDASRGIHHALWAAIMPYRPSDKVIEWTLKKPDHYFVKIGHGYNSCPEIYSGDKSYLLSAGGANQGRRSMIMSRPTVLFLDDDARLLEETFHAYGPGENFINWNNTGVYEDFSCTKGMVHIPAGKQPVLSSDEWQIFNISEAVFLAVYSKKELGLMVIVRAPTAKEALEAIVTGNPDKELYPTQFKHPNGNFIEYDLDSPKNKWVIKSVNNKPVNRQFDRWPLLDGNIEW